MTDEPKKKAQGRIKTSKSEPHPPPKRTADGREKQLVDIAMDLAEKQMREGTATSQVITHFLKLGTQQERLAREKLENETALLKAKVEDYESKQRTEVLYGEALKAMRTYSGSKDVPIDGADYDD